MSSSTILPLRIARARAAVALLIALTLASALAPGSATGRAVEHGLDVIVRSSGGAGQAAAAVAEHGGSVRRSLPIVDGVAATVDAAALDDLRRDARVWQVSEDSAISFNGAWSDPGTPNRLARIVRSDKLWSQGTTGAGVTVALLDTGIYAAHPDLAGRVVHCEDFSHERNSEAHCADTFGHGTFMAGLIAGNGSASGGRYEGSAPGARLVAIKAAGFDGATDISTILAGIQWTVAHKDLYGIRVLNLSLGSDSAQDYRLSPLNFAVERAWRSGIVVVVSSGNDGPGASTVMKPGDDPYVVTVGASNDQGTIPVGDDTVPVFSSRGPTRANGFAKPDVVAPGVHTVSLRSPGSAIDQMYGAHAVVGDSYFRGTGTSMSTALTSGVVAQILQRNPALSPDQVKHRLVSTARPIATGGANDAGAGEIDAYAAATSLSLASANQGLSPATGLGSLQGDRGSLEVEVTTAAGSAALSGEWSAQSDPSLVSLDDPLSLVPFARAEFVLTGWDPLTWDLTSFSSEDWAGMSWKGMSWKATVWDGMSWKGMSWKNADWDGMSWKNADWDGMSWKASNWQSKWYAAAWD